MPQILLIEDEAHLREVIQLNLELEGWEVVALEDASGISEVINNHRFDLVLLDVMLPDIDGFEACSLIRKSDPEIPVMFLTARNATEDRIKGLKTGADDYLSKPFHLEELILRVKNLLKRKPEVPADEYEFAGNRIDFAGYKCYLRNGNVVELTKREAELLKMLVKRKGAVVSRDEILEKLWPDESIPSPRVIDNYILNFRKLFENELKNRYFQSVRGVGYRFSPPEEAT